MSDPADSEVLRPGTEERRSAVLDAALGTFARFGYRKTSMDDIAADARISRPGLYFLFSSKAALFRAATQRAIELDLAAAELALAATDRPLVDRVVEAFDSWAGRYLGSLSDVTALVESDPDLVGPIASTGPVRFERILTTAIRGSRPERDPETVAATLVSVSVGLKHQVGGRDEYLTRLRAAVGVVLEAS